METTKKQSRNTRRKSTKPKFKKEVVVINKAPPLPSRTKAKNNKKKSSSRENRLIRNNNNRNPNDQNLLILFIMAITNPGALQTPRVPTMSSSKTATTCTHFQIATNTAVSTYELAFCFRNILRNVIYRISEVTTRYVAQVPSCTNDSGAAVFSNPSTIFNITQYVQENSTDATAWFDQPIRVACWLWDGSTGSNPHGNVLYSGTHPSKEELRAFWIDVDTTMTINYTNPGAGASWQLTVWMCNEKGFFPINNANIAAATTSLTIFNGGQARGYYALSVKLMLAPADSTFQTLAVQSLTMDYDQCEIYAHRSIAQFEDFYSTIDAVRVIGTDVLWTNTTSSNNNSGDILALQVPENHHWQDYIGTDNTGDSIYAQLANEDDVYTDNLKKGVHQWLSPNGVQDFDYQEDFTIEDGVLVDSHYPIIDTRAFMITEVKATAANATAVTGHWVFKTAIEFMTLGMFFDAERPIGKSSIFNLVFDELSKYTERVTENPNHLSNIWNWLKTNVPKAFDWGQRNLPIIGKAIANVAESVQSVSAAFG